MGTNKMNKLFLILGIGIGLLTSGMLNIAYPKIKYISYTEAQIIEKARELGMVFLKESIIEKGEEKNANISNNTNDNAHTVEDENIVKIIINKGDNSEKIINKLYEEGIIKDKEEFAKKIAERELQRRFKYGVFELKTEMEYDSLIKILTGR